jgi:hypothetical protein
MGLFSRNKDKPAWLDQTREFCRAQNIVIAAWGPQGLVVEAKSPERRGEIAALLANLGFQVVADENDEYAGLLELRHPD